MRHADRCVVFTPPSDIGDVHAAMTGAASALPPGKMLLIWHGAPAGSGATLHIARQVASDLNLQFVQWPDGPADMADRTWCYALQKHSGRGE